VDLGVDRRIILKLIFREWNGGHGLGLSGSEKGPEAGSCECGNEPSG